MSLCVHSAAGMHEGLGSGPGWRVGGEGDSLSHPGRLGPQHPEELGGGQKDRHVLPVERCLGGDFTSPRLAHMLTCPSWKARQEWGHRAQDRCQEGGSHGDRDASLSSHPVSLLGVGWETGPAPPKQGGGQIPRSCQVGSGRVSWCWGRLRGAQTTSALGHVDSG